VPRLLPATFRLPAMLLTVFALMLPAHAQEFVSIKGNQVNVRKEPTTKAEVLWHLDHGYPLQVEERKEQWMKVRDHEAPLGWVSVKLTSNAAHHLVVASKVNLRAGPGSNHKVLAQLQENEVLRTLKKEGDWVQVKRSSGQTGWVAKKLMWGW